jgi:hypothetical protein
MPMMTLNLALLFVFGLASRQFAFRNGENFSHCVFETLRWFFGLDRFGLWHGKNVSPIDRNRKFIIRYLDFERFRNVNRDRLCRNSPPDQEQSCQDRNEQKRIEQAEHGVHALTLSSGVWN